MTLCFSTLFQDFKLGILAVTRFWRGVYSGNRDNLICAKEKKHLPVVISSKRKGYVYRRGPLQGGNVGH